MTNEDQDSSGVQACELCIVGAGIAGMNALYAASRYLKPDDKVILVDRNPKPGGMWNQTYNYVRLHQPHRMFTAGDIPWEPARTPAHLADRTEVLDHFDHCLQTLQAEVQLEQRYGCLYLSHREVEEADGSYSVLVECAEGDESGKRVQIKARRCVKALGFQIPQNAALPFSSTNVRSISPDSFDLLGEEMRASDKPVYIVGGGKTAMDTAHALLSRFKDKQVSLMVGRGTVFTSRDTTFPTGLRRWWGGKTSLETFLELGLLFDGDNEDEVLDYFSAHYTTQLNPQCRQFVFGVLSQAENDVIASGARDIVMDYVSDIIDEGDATVMVLRSGERRVIERDAWIINCTGYVLREPHPYEPYLSEHGAVVSVQPTSTIHFLTSFDAYFLVHLFYLDKLQTLPLYELDFQGLNECSKSALPFTAMVHLLYNIGLIVEAVPNSVMLNCGLDFDRWFPLHRRLFAVSRLRADGAHKRAHFRRALDRVRERFEVRCGPLVH